MTDEATLLVGDTYLNRGNLMMIADTNGFSPEQVALFGTRYKHDAAADANGQLSLTVHQRSYGKVCQRKQCTSLTDIASIQMFFCHHHLCDGMVCVHFCNPATSIGSKAIRTIQ